MSQEDTGLVAAVSDDLPGLLVVGKSVREVMDELGPAARGLIEEMCDCKVSVEIQEGPAPSGFRAHDAVARIREEVGAAA